VREQWDKVGDMAGADVYNNGMEGIMDIVGRVQAHREAPADEAKEVREGPDVELIKKFLSEPKEFSYTSRDVILYNLGLGASTLDKDGLRYLYEGDDNFGPLPTFGVIPAFAASVGLITGEVDGLEIDLTRVLHGEQYVELLGPLPPSGDLTSTWRVSDILDKGKGMVVITEVETKDDQGRPLIRNQASTFVVGKGGFGGARDSPSVIPPAKIPSRAPDASREFKTNADQAALYRLSGDPNPLHIDPMFAAMGGFSTPILHGLCSYGIAVRHILEQFGEAEGGPEAVAKVKVRFASPVLPGQTLRTNMWKEGKRVLFTSEVAETGKKCLDGGYVEFRQ